MDDLVLPDDWARPSDIKVASAREIAFMALAAPDLASYYRPDLNYGGASFASLGSNDPYGIGPDDLHAVAMLSVSVGPLGTRQLLKTGSHRDRVLAALQAVPLDVALADAAATDLVAAYALHEATRDALKNPYVKGNSNPWVTASKLTARKRPHLIPVRDNVVGNAFGPEATKRASVYWLTMRALLRDREVGDALADTRRRLYKEAKAGGFDVVLDESQLRLLDAALWKHLVRGTNRDTVAEEAE